MATRIADDPSIGKRMAELERERQERINRPSYPEDVRTPTETFRHDPNTGVFNAPGTDYSG